MTFLLTVTAAFAGCNLHFCLYGAFGLVLVLRGALALRERKPAEAQEHGAHGLVHILLALL